MNNYKLNFYTHTNPLMLQTNANHLQVLQNQLERIAIRHTANTNNNTVNQESKLLPFNLHTAIYSSNLRYNSTNPEHPLNHLLHDPSPSRTMKKSIFNNTDNLTLLHHAHPIKENNAYKLLNNIYQQYQTTIF